MSRDLRARWGSLAYPWGYVVLSALLLAGCATLGGGDGTYLLRAVNRSGEVVQEVVIKNADGEMKGFGMLGQNGTERVMKGCSIMLSDRFTIIGYFNGVRMVRMLNLSKYLPYKDQIASLTFSYLGQYEWSVVARNAAGVEIKPGLGAAAARPQLKAKPKAAATKPLATKP
jgi:hypothetical protein